MMGRKERAFGPLPPLTLEDLVPLDHFYRHLERSLDLIFVRDLVRDRYAPGGRPSVDPVVFFKLQLVMFFEAIVEQCLAAGLVWGRELYFDATKVAANASLDSVGPRFAVEAHLATLFDARDAGAPDDQGPIADEAVPLP